MIIPNRTEGQPSITRNALQHMQITKIFVLLFGLAGLLPTVSFAADADLFVDTPESIPSAWENVDANIVIRQRAVWVQFERLAPDQNEILELNFFDDVHLTAIRDRVEFSDDGARAWIGTVSSDQSGSATFVWRHNQLTGTVYAESSAYQVRHIQDELHLVREILRPQIESRASAAWRAPIDDEEEVVALVNQERQINQLPPLQVDSQLHAAALGHSEDMALNDYFSHTSLDNRDPGDRITQAGYAWNTYGENIAAGYSTPTAVVEGWMNSPGHRANILRSSFCDIGVGLAYSAASRYRYYWTQNFGRKQGVSVCQPTQQYTISAVSGIHGRILPSGVVTVNAGGGASFTITPDAGYRIRDVLIDNQSMGPMESYTFTNVTRDHTIEALFEVLSPVRYSISAGAGSHGRILPSGTVTVDAGDSAFFSIVADAGYRIRDVLIDNQSMGPVESYTFTNVSRDHTIEALFEKRPPVRYSISAGAGSHGRISPEGEVTVDAGDSASFKIVADAGYRIRDVLIDYQSMGPVDSYTFTNVSKDHSIVAFFEKEHPPKRKVPHLPFLRLLLLDE